MRGIPSGRRSLGLNDLFRRHLGLEQFKSVLSVFVTALLG